MQVGICLYSEQDPSKNNPWNKNMSVCVVCVSVQAQREPAAIAKSTGCESVIPHEKLTLAQARRGTPGHTSQKLLLLLPRSLCFHQISMKHGGRWERRRKILVRGSSADLFSLSFILWDRVFLGGWRVCTFCYKSRWKSGFSAFIEIS